MSGASTQGVGAAAWAYADVVSAVNGPSLMPGGSPAAWPQIKPIFQAICAKTPEGEPCCDWMGENGAGHFVKMVHNGIEYGDMQLICEIYDLMKRGVGLTSQQMHDAFAEWNQGELDSYLIEITRDILAYKDEEGHEVLDRKSTRLNSSHRCISYAVFCLKKKN